MKLIFANRNPSLFPILHVVQYDHTTKSKLLLFLTKIKLFYGSKIGIGLKLFLSKDKINCEKSNMSFKFS